MHCLTGVFAFQKYSSLRNLNAYSDLKHFMFFFSLKVNSNRRKIRVTAVQTKQMQWNQNRSETNDPNEHKLAKNIPAFPHHVPHHACYIAVGLAELVERRTEDPHLVRCLKHDAPRTVWLDKFPLARHWNLHCYIQGRTGLNGIPSASSSTCGCHGVKKVWSPIIYLKVECSFRAWKVLWSALHTRASVNELNREMHLFTFVPLYHVSC